MSDDEQPLADGLFAVARALRDLGNADAATPMGAMEALGAVLKEHGVTIADSASEIGAALDQLAFIAEARIIATALEKVSTALDGIAAAIREAGR
jgi:hypothetical protein